MGQGRFWAFSFALDDKAYGGTGRPMFSSLTPLNDFWGYDLQTEQWTQLADFPGGVREGATGFSAMGRGFAGFGSPFIQFSKDLYEFLPDSNRWVAKASVPGIGFAFSHGFVIDSIFYIGPENGTNQVYAYNVITNVWDTVAPFPGTDRRAQVAFSVGGKGYLGLGAGVFGGVLGDFWSYDPQTNVWTQVADLSPKSDQSAAFAIGDYGYVHNVGGNQKNLHRYDPLTDTWEFETSLPGVRIANATACANDSLGFLLFGERTVSGGNFASDTIFVFTPGTEDTTTLATDLRRDWAGLYWYLDQTQLTIATNGAQSHGQIPATVHILDLEGQKLLQGVGSLAEGISLSVASLPRGLYLLKAEMPGRPPLLQKWLW